MAPIKRLARVLTDEVHGEFHITLEAEGGETFQVAATEQQIADLIDELDDLLGDDADEDEVTEHKEMGDE
ncbi:hypothetical protein [Methylobacterium durans]|uniref:Uncharacterized protein n=1 Tax=Methylobacterium durans TaxID=2202825 RepID=A0A2U8WGI0_9HYPH|nr:hypothetical protein [Methylobacterium durans]AWN44382.1 hypothetical protein DK389_05430 [Methylobacterium durans]